MKQIMLVALAALLSTLTLNAQNVQEAFAAMPQSLTNLEKNQRLDLIDFFQSADNRGIKDALGDTIRLHQLTDNYLLMASGKSTLQLLTLPLAGKDGSVFCLIYTSCAPVCDSQIRFYSSEWEPLDTDRYFSPVGKEWFVKDSERFPALDIDFMQYTYDPEQKQLIQHYNTIEYLTLEDQKAIKAQIKEESKRYSWKADRFQ